MSYLLEMIVIALLSITILFCWRLNNKMAVLRNSSKDMAHLVKVLDDAIINTNNSLAALKATSVNAAHDLRKCTSQSNELISELSFMNDAATKISNRLEHLLGEMREVEQSCNSLILQKARIVKIKKKAAIVLKAPIEMAKKRDVDTAVQHKVGSR